MVRPAVGITLSAVERQELEGLARRRKTAQGLARRARIVLAVAAGLENQTIADQVGAAANTVGKWRCRFAERRVDGLHDEPRSGAPRKIGDEQIAEVVTRTLEETPPDGRSMDASLDASIFFERLGACSQVQSSIRPVDAAGLTPLA